MNVGRFKWFLGFVTAIGLLIAAGWTAWGRQVPSRKAGTVAPTPEGRSTLPASTPKGSISLVEAMLKPSDLPFQEPTTIEHVELHLRKLLGAPVVIDRAALERKELTLETTVRIDRLEGVRLKTALKLLLEPVGLVARVLADDHLLLITDHEGSEEPLDRVFAELKAIHREMHDMQDSLDEVYNSVVDEDAAADDEASLRKAARVRKKLGKARARLQSPSAKLRNSQ